MLKDPAELWKARAGSRLGLGGMSEVSPSVAPESDICNKHTVRAAPAQDSCPDYHFYPKVEL